MLRNILAIIIGLFLGGVFNMMMITVSQVIYPYPEGVDPNNMEQVREHIEANGFPVGALLIVLIAHAGGSFVSGFLCGLISKSQWYIAAGAMGLFWTLGGVMMLFILPAPLWFGVVDVISYVPAALLGVMIGGSLLKPSDEAGTSEKAPAPEAG